MSVDRRSVKTDALETLGMIIDANQKRDAIHIAVEPVVAAQKLRPGEDVGFVEGGVGVCDDPVGIVDPFLTENVKKGEYFWLLVYPRQITSLHHVWTHPAFEAVTNRETDRRKASEYWLRDFISDRGRVSYEEVLEEAVNRPDAMRFGDDIVGEIPAEFWSHVEVVTGNKIPQYNRAGYFSCAC